MQDFEVRNPNATELFVVSKEGKQCKEHRDRATDFYTGVFLRTTFR